MKNYNKYFLICIFTLFGFYYINKIIDYSEKNNVLLVSINNYAKDFDYKCREGSITTDGIVLGLAGLKVNKDRSYNNMKGTLFNEKLIEYDKNDCILNKENNLDKYIIKGNDYVNNISLVIDVDNLKYYRKMLKVGETNDIELNLLMNFNNLRNEIDNIDNHSNILFKGKNKEELNDFIGILHNEFYCVKNSEQDIIEMCKNKKINSINIINYVSDNLLSNTKKILDKGVIIFIKETNSNLNELSSTIKYIKSRGYNIVSINELLS